MLIFFTINWRRTASDEVGVIDLGSRKVLGQYFGDLFLYAVGVRIDDRRDRILAAWRSAIGTEWVSNVSSKIELLTKQ